MSNPVPSCATSFAVPPGIGVVAACWAVQQLPVLPAPALAHWLLVVGCLLLALAALSVSRPMPAQPARWLAVWLPFVGAGLFAAGWALLQARAHLDNRLDPRLEGVRIGVVGIVEEMPQRVGQGLRFRFRIERCVDPATGCPGPVSVRLGWYRGLGKRAANGPPELRPGERWRLLVRLRRPHAPLNPGLFDQELRALEDDIAAMGAVLQPRDAPQANVRLDAFVPRWGALIERARHLLRAAMIAAMRPDDATPVSSSADARTSAAPNDPALSAGQGIVIALAVGDQGAIPGPWWELFNRTGVGHLMSISGLHITMLAALGGQAAGRLWSSPRLAARMRRRTLPALLPTPYLRWVVGLLTGFGYALLAGWGIPAQRTCWMLAAAGLAMLSGRARAPLPVLATAAAVVCLLDPWAPMAAGFWLSFAAVGAIIWFGSQRTGPGRASAADDWRARSLRFAREALRSQIAATLSLLPLGVLFFSSLSLVGPLANAVAIPLVSVVVTPLALAGAALAPMLPWLASLALRLGASLSDLLLMFLSWLDHGGSGAIAMGLPRPPALLVAVAACVILLAPLRWPGRAVASIGLLPLLLPAGDALAPGAFRLHALDIGQGTAVLIETGAGRLLYDAGPTIGADGDAGARTIVPWLRSRGIDRLDALVVSHQDADHAGGALSVLRGVRVGWVASSLPDEHPIVAASAHHYRCRRGEGWRWGEVAFDWLHPGDDDPTPKRAVSNARSCVLRIRSSAGVALLTGDIEAAQEALLLARLSPDALRATVLLAPHHGSKTSSTPGFLDAVHPAVAVFQLGYRNRYRHPDPNVLQRYRDRGIEILRSDAHGAISLRFTPGEPGVRSELARVDQARYWRVMPGPGSSGPEDDE